MSTTKLHDLIALAKEPSSARRRELLRGVTDLFFTAADPRATSEMSLFDDIMTQLAGEMEEAVRIELAQRIGGAEPAPLGLVRTLAQDASIEVASPVLQNSTALTDDDLLRVAQTRGQDHLRAISRRTVVSEAVSEVIVERGDDVTVGALLANEGARLSRQTHEAVVDRAAENPALQAAVISRQALPIDLLNEMYFIVEARLRDQILARNAALDPAALDAALAVSRKQVAARDGTLPPDYDEAERSIRVMKARGAITPPVLASMLRNGETTRFLVALCELADIDFHTARRILERHELDALSIVCKAADFDRSLYLTFAVLILDREDNAMGRAREYGELYEALPREAAQRTIRFWRLRRQTGDVAAA